MFYSFFCSYYGFVHTAESKSRSSGPITGSFSFPKFQLLTLSATLFLYSCFQCRNAKGAALISGLNHFFIPLSFLLGSKKDTSENVSFHTALFFFLFTGVVEIKLICLFHLEMTAKIVFYVKGIPVIEIG